MLTDIRVTESKNCDEFGEVYEPLLSKQERESRQNMAYEPLFKLTSERTENKKSEHAYFFKRTICGKKGLRYGEFAQMSREDKREFFEACSFSQSCPITNIWFQRTNTTEREATIREFVPGLYLGFVRSSFDSYLFDDFIYETATRSTK